MLSLKGTFVTDNYADTRAFDPVKRSDFRAGYQLRKKTATFVPKKFVRVMTGLTDSEIRLLKYFEEDVEFGEKTFEFYDYKTNKYYFVYLGEECLPLKFNLDNKSNQLWELELSLIQANRMEYDMSIIQATSYQRHIELIEDLAPGAEITNRLILGFEEDTTLLSIYLQVRGTPYEIDDDNTVEVTIKNSSGQTVISKIYDLENQPLSNGFESLGELLIDEFDVGDMLFLDFILGEKANMPDCALQIRTERTIEI